MNLKNPSETRYLLCVEGHLGDGWVDWSCEVETRQELDGAGGRAVTTLAVTLPDQPALHGVLEIIRDLNLKLISVQLLEEEEK